MFSVPMGRPYRCRKTQSEVRSRAVLDLFLQYMEAVSEDLYNRTARQLNEGEEINDALLQEIRKTLTTLDISIDDFNRAVEKEYGKSG